MADPDAKVLDLCRALFVYLMKYLSVHALVVLAAITTNFSVRLQGPYQIDGDDLAICLLDLPQLHQKVPEP